MEQGEEARIAVSKPQFNNPLHRFHCDRKISEFSLWPRVYADWYTNPFSNENKPAIFESRPGETGMDRLKEMYFKDEYGDWSPDLIRVAQVASGGFCVGIVLGARMGGVEAKEDWVRRNNATVYVSQLDGRRRLQDNIMVGMMKGAYRIGWRVSLFSSTFMLTTTTVSVYNNNSSALDYLLGGMVAGGLYRWNMGLRAMASTCFFGGCLGLIGGSVYMLIQRITGTSYEEIRYWRSMYKVRQQSEVYGTLLEQRNKLLREQVSKEGVLQQAKTESKAQNTENNKS